jgi:hypothetical protein
MPNGPDPQVDLPQPLPIVSTVGVPTDETKLGRVKFASASKVTEPTCPVADWPVTVVLNIILILGVPTDPVDPPRVTGTLFSLTVVAVPSADVADNPESTTGEA